MKTLLPLRLSISLNSRGSSKGAVFAKAAKVKAERLAVHVALTSQSAVRQMEELRALNRSGRWTVTLTRVAPRELDDDNLAGRFKAVRDQVAQEMNINDRDRNRLRFVVDQRKGSPEAVEIYIQPRLDWAWDELARIHHEIDSAKEAHEASLGGAQ